MKIQYCFSGKLWQHPGPGGWYFISLPVNISNEITSLHKSEEEGWGRLKAKANIGKVQWG